MKRFKNKVVIVIGTSRGIGQAIAVAFARMGAKVASVARGDQGETANRVRDEGGDFLPLAMDLSSGTQKEATELVAKTLQPAGRIDVLVNNAGIIRRAPAVDVSEGDWNEVLRTNLSIPFFLCQATAKWWLAGGRAFAPAAARLKIVNLATLLSFQGGILVPAYNASKHGIAGITRALANEWAKERINVNAIAPGYIATENTRALREDAGRNRSVLECIPENRWGSPEDIAGSYLFWLPAMRTISTVPSSTLTAAG
jgi:2-deoxy-D-gluconate 3-dehydrogenase